MNNFVVEFCVWQLEKNYFNLLDTLATKLENKLPGQIKVVLTDIHQSNLIEKSDICVGFGDIAYSAMLDQAKDRDLFKAPNPNLMLGKNAKEYKEKTIKVLREIVKIVKKSNNKEETKIIVEDSSGKTFGPDGEINITPEEAKYLKSIKEIIGGGTIIIKKGKLELRIEDNDN